MSNESVQIQVSQEEVREIVQSVLTARSSVLVNSRPIDHLVTVEDRCRERWPAATKKSQRRIRDVCLGIHRERLGRHPYKLTGHLNGVYAIEREHIELLDRAIDLVRGEVEARESTPLFPRPAN